MGDRVRAVLFCDVSGAGEPSLAFVDAIARLRLVAWRLGFDLRVRGADRRLRELLTLTGLGGVLLADDILAGDVSAAEPHRQPEQREHPLDVEEVGDGADPAG